MGVVSVKTLSPGEDWTMIPGFDGKALQAAIAGVSAVTGKEVKLSGQKIADLEARQAWLKSYSAALGGLVKAAAAAAAELSRLAKAAKDNEDEAKGLEAAAGRAQGVAANAGSTYKSIQ